MKQVKRAHVILILVMLLIMFGIFYLYSSHKTIPTTEHYDRKETVRLAVTKALITAPILLAHRLNYFSEEGLNVIMNAEFSSGRESFEFMLAGKADIAEVATTPVVFNSFKRKDYAIFATHTTTYDGIKIVARKDKGIHSAADLKNKTIGIVPGTISQILLDAFLAYNKILVSEVTIVGFKGFELPDALINGQVDAISVWEPYANNALEHLEKNGVQIPTSQVYRIALNMAVMNDYARQNPIVLEKVVRALIRATDFIKDHNEQALELISQIMEMDKKLIAEVWRDILFSISLDQLLLKTMENEANWAIRHEFPDVKEIPNYMEFINYKALENVAPELVTIIRKVE